MWAKFYSSRRTLFVGWSESGTGRPLLKNAFVGAYEVLFREPSLLDAKAATLLAVVDDLRQGIVLMLQVWLIAGPGGGVGVVDLGAIDLLERLHRADDAGQLKIGVVGWQVA